MKNYTRKTIGLPVELWKAISDFRYKNRIPTEAEALRILVSKMLKVKYD